MSRTTAQVSFLDEIIVDSFAGGGGASTGIELATGRPVTIAINHDPDAILMHKTNHPYTEHYQASVWDVDPREVCQGLPQWVILGAETGNRMDKVKPRREWVDQIAEFCAENEIPVFYKDNLRAYFPDLPPSALPWSNQESATTEWAAHFMGRFERQV